MDKEDAQRLTEALEQFNKSLNKFQNGGGFNGIHFDAGGIAVGVLVALVAVLLTVCFMQSGTISNFERKLDRNEDYVNQIYRNLERLKEAKK